VIVASTAGGMAALRLADGGVAWQVSDAFPVRCVGSPLLVEGVLIASCGEGGSGKRLVAVHPPTSAEAAPELAYELRKSVPQSPTPVALGELLFVWHDRGIVTCCDAATGAVKWQERVGGRYYGSPIVAGDKLIAVTETGEVVTLAARAEFAELGRVRLEETCHATPAVLRGMLVVRTEARLRAVSVMR
jgi:outer membrane protein assembly factor BamB